jgi:hypothetical protein
MTKSGEPSKPKWTIGVITAPRKKGYYLDQTLRSLKNAGWSDIVVFAEPGSPIPDDFTGHVVHRRKQYGDWTNWASGLYELFLSEPDTDYFFMAEDDALVCQGAKWYLEQTIPQLGEFGSLSIYTPSKYRHKSRGFFNCCQGIETWSTVTVIMPHRSVWQFFSDPDVQKHRFEDIFKVQTDWWLGTPHASYGKGYTSIIDTVGNTVKDAVIGKWGEKNHLPIYYHTPALAEHIGYYSTLTEDFSEAANGRMTSDFVGEEADLKEWANDPAIKLRGLGLL